MMLSTHRLWPLHALLAFSIASCTQPAQSTQPGSSYEGEIVLFDFYDQEVEVFQDKTSIMRGVIDVSDSNESTGLSWSKRISIDKCAKISISTRNDSFSEEICPEKADFKVLVNPNIAPKIKLLYGDAAGLD